MTNASTTKKRSRIIIWLVATPFLLLGSCAACMMAAWAMLPDCSGTDTGTGEAATPIPRQEASPADSTPPEATPDNEDPARAAQRWMKSRSLDPGSISGLQRLAPWACGGRAGADVDGVYHVFYVRDSAVVSVYRFPERGDRELVWRGQNSECSALDDRARTVSATADLPRYTVLSVMRRAGRYKQGDILVKSMSPKTPKTRREQVLRAIMKKENLDEANLYCSKAAYKADMSERFQKTHPHAMDCSLGGILSSGPIFD